MGKKVFFLTILSAILATPNLIDCRASDYRDRKILYINSYHEGYYWSDGEQAGAERILIPSGVELRVIYMDTKNRSSEEEKNQAGLTVKEYIKEFKPEVVIAADDNAFKYVIIPYYREAKLPVVFCGINWDISEYRAPYLNTTGMIEVGLYKGIYEHLKKFTQGDKIGYIGADVLSARKNATYHAFAAEGNLTHKEHVSDFESWKKKYLEIQEKVDMIILGSHSGIKNWNQQEAEEFIFENIRIPIGTESRQLISAALLGLAKVPQEQGEYAAKAALRILDGENPSDIPIVVNKKGDLMLNLRIAGKLNIIFTPTMLKNATQIIKTEQ